MKYIFIKFSIQSLFFKVHLEFEYLFQNVFSILFFRNLISIYILFDKNLTFQYS